MLDPDVILDLRNAAALSRAEALSLMPPDDGPAPHNPFAPPLPNEEGDSEDKP